MYRGNALSLLGLFLITFLLIRFLLPLIFPFLLGLGLALIAEPLVTFGCRRLRLPRAFCAGIGVLLTFCAMTVLILLLCAFAVRELGFLAGVVPDLAQTARSGMALVERQLLNLTDHTPQNLQPMLRQSVNAAFSDGTALLNRAVQYVLTLAGNLLTHVPDSALTVGTAIISAFMISGKLPRLKALFLAQIHRRRLQPLLKSLHSLRSALGCWLTAQLKLVGVCALVLLLGLTLLRIPYAPIWALVICLVDALPVLGTGAVLLPWSLILYLQSDTARALGMLGIYTTISVLRSVLEPKFLGKQLGLDPLLTLAALYAGYKIWGIMGMILAPLLAVTAVQLLPAQNEKL